jgi:acyl-CoA synthetase (NDP forming)
MSESNSNQEASARVKEARRVPQEEKVSLGTRLKKKLSKKQRGDFKIRVTKYQSRANLDTPHTWIWNHYRDEDAARGALKTLGKKFSFYFLEILNPDGQVIVDNKEEFEARRRHEYKLRGCDELQ